MTTAKFKFDRIVNLDSEWPTHLGFSSPSSKTRSNSFHKIDDVDLGESILKITPTIVAQHPEARWEVSVQGTSILVNGKECKTSREINSGDMIRFEGYLWEFMNAAGTPPRLVPTRHLVAQAIRLLEIEVKERLDKISLQIDPGRLVAITGESGAGKSTLAKAVVGKLACRGEVLLYDGDSNGWVSSKEGTFFTDNVAFVPQENVLHSDLSVKQQLWFWGKLRDEHLTESDVDRALELVDLAEHSHKFVKELSGGMKRRLAIASALVRKQAILVMDEPASGLDPKKEEELLRVIRRVCSLGATAILVTHGLQFCEAYDSQIKLGQNEKSTKRKPGEIKEITGFGVKLLDPSSLEFPTRNKGKADPRVTDTHKPRLKKTWTLLQREFLKLWQRDAHTRMPLYVILNLVLLPILFGCAVGLATPSGNASLLGILTIVSTIWMSTSIGSTAIVDERELIDHEVHQGTSQFTILLVKTITLSVIAVLQCGMLFFTAWLVRKYFLGFNHDQSGLHLKLLPILWVVAFAGLCMGLTISSIAGTRPRFAAVVMPLIMMIQILFNPIVAQKDKGGEKDSPEETYKNFCVQKCGGARYCNNNNLTYWQSFSDWLCDDCSEQAKKLQRSKQIGPLSASERKTIESKLQEGKSTDVPASLVPARKVQLYAAAISQITLTRYADAAFRECAFESGEESIFAVPDATGEVKSKSVGLIYRARVSWFWNGLSTLLFMSLCFFLSAFGWMSLQAWRKSG